MKLADNEYDLLVIGGGVNGTGIAADAAGRGLKVLLCEQSDLASATSSNSSKLIHGGLRYLEHYEFRLVKEALAEREVLLKNAPHIMWPLTFRLPHQKHLRPAWMIRIGLFMYDNLAKRVTLPASKSIKFGEHSVLEPTITKGFEYADGWVDDSRLVILNALAAQERGAVIATQTKCVKAHREQGTWQVTLEQQETKQHYDISVRGIVNAAGPWVAKLFDETLEEKSPQNIRLVKGSHIVVPRIHDESHAYILQNKDNRIVFVLPFEDDYSLIGTTDVEYNGAAQDVKISDEEIDYLIDITNNYFKKLIKREDIVHTFSGVRPLLDDESVNAQAVTRDYKLELSSDGQRTPLLSVFGGKITTYRKLAEAAINKLESFYPQIGKPWTKHNVLPGGDFSSVKTLKKQLKSSYKWLPEVLLNRLIRTYGTRAVNVLGGTKQLSDLGQNFGHNLYAAEVDYLLNYEWANSTSDILWRRTKLGLRFNPEQITTLNHYIEYSKSAKSA
ncbi:glycerol-3-phosphate dehydrogenase (plasmid) [Pseudoalteromonas nigrifaciens]|uniref:Glycerol-3-phosphate dehydrogenase n=1 Tax=Pseudoalteromonas nigrifaciens TaxID=28109 RepID=A0AAC9XZK8_9GAMM|nr:MULTISPECIES: glycerol-3-phosphate dehydrogenase [Pseudoalteromonas]ASM56315.1 glycerol-3-phosphate dehydrogenase [Pseudoalteromonas nigrifaciens]PCC09906.1 glycerol-3-phosphate dehydrogenase [Pseudoalteromonas sp. JB197]SJN41176.1 Aerobic glycerol-3-phosphate dehydrogenase [Pseudoalteromonas sp. JB197]SUD25079.1 Aerobic glycerol-3-phosphate dehydrogenase [Pseudoalteromonas nigrifaciens]GEN43289.1 glycerol-3-phosphate dehydrogenase [Pseudoalteromonas nigrifaciens]